MGFRLYKSVSLGKGVRLNLSKTGVGISAGIPGARYSVHSSGRTVKTVGLPGTGIYYRTDTYAKGRRSSPRPERRSLLTPIQHPTPAPQLKAGLFASKSARRFVEGVQKFMAGDAAGALPLFEESSERDSDSEHIAEEFFLGMCLVNAERHQEAIEPFRTVVAGAEIPDERMRAHGIEGDVQVQVTPQVRATLPISNLGAALMLAEVYQRCGQSPQAIELLESLGSVAAQPIFALSLAELYAESGAWNEVIRVGDGFDHNTDDVTLALLVLRARAMREKGHFEAGLAVCKEALRFRKRSIDLLHAARYERALDLQSIGKKAQSAKELQRIYGEDPGFADVAELIEQTGGD